jgi:hypothetical protein
MKMGFILIKHYLPPAKTSNPIDAEILFSMAIHVDYMHLSGRKSNNLLVRMASFFIEKGKIHVICQ